MKNFSKTTTVAWVAALITLPGICLAGGSSNTADTKLLVHSSAIANIAAGKKSTADLQAGSITQTGQSGSKATTYVRIEKSLVINAAIGDKSTARLGLGQVVQN